MVSTSSTGDRASPTGDRASPTDDRVVATGEWRWAGSAGERLEVGGALGAEGAVLLRRP